MINQYPRDVLNPPGPRMRKGRAGKFHRIQREAVQAPLVVGPEVYRPARGRLIAEFGMLVGWFALWLLNGAATALGLAFVGGWLARRGVFIDMTARDWLVIGAVAHVFISSVEQHIWRVDYEIPAGLRERARAFFANADPLRLGLAVFIGALDTISTAWYARRMLFMLVDPRWGWNIVAALLAGGIALSAEPMMRNFARQLRDLVRGYQQ